MRKMLFLAASCVACTALSAQEEVVDPITSTEEVGSNETSNDGAAPSLTKKKDDKGGGCGCGGGGK